MADDPTSKVAKTFWFQSVSDGYYLIPDDVEPAPGELELRTLTGKRRLVDAEAVKAWATDLQGASEHLAGVAREGVEKIQAELEASWRGGQAQGARGAPSAASGASEAGDTGDTSAKISESAAEQAEALAQIIESASSAAASALRKLSRKLRQDEHDSGVQPKPDKEG